MCSRSNSLPFNLNAVFHLHDWRENMSVNMCVCTSVVIKCDNIIFIWWHSSSLTNAFIPIDSSHCFVLFPKHVDEDETYISNYPVSWLPCSEAWLRMIWYMCTNVLASRTQAESSSRTCLPNYVASSPGRNNMDPPNFENHRSRPVLF